MLRFDPARWQRLVCSVAAVACHCRFHPFAVKAHVDIIARPNAAVEPVIAESTNANEFDRTHGPAAIATPLRGCVDVRR